MTPEQSGRAYMTSIHRLRAVTCRELDRAQTGEEPNTEALDAAIAEVLAYRTRYADTLSSQARASSAV